MSRVSGQWSVYTRPYAIGGAIEIALPFHLSLEVDALYRRTTSIENSFMNPQYGTITRRAANSWEFPMLLGHQWNRRFRPFVSAGGTFRRIQGFDLTYETFASGFNPDHSVSRMRLDEPLTQGGYIVAAGFMVPRTGRLRISPQFRYTRWTSIRFQPTQNQFEFLLRAGF